MTTSGSDSREEVYEIELEKGMEHTLKPYQLGSIIIESVPDGADVYVEDRLIGKTPLTVQKLEAREYDVRLSLKGYENQSLKIPVIGGKATETLYLLVKESP